MKKSSKKNAKKEAPQYPLCRKCERREADSGGLCVHCESIAMDAELEMREG